MTVTARRYVIVALFRALDVGAEFDRTHWPAHVTLVSNFTTGASIARLAATMRRVLAPKQPLQLEFGGTEMFGRGRDIPVRLVRSESAIALHEELIAALTRGRPHRRRRTLVLARGLSTPCDAHASLWGR